MGRSKQIPPPPAPRRFKSPAPFTRRTLPKMSTGKNPENADLDPTDAAASGSYMSGEQNVEGAATDDTDDDAQESGS